MATLTTLYLVTAEVETSVLRELQWGIDFWAGQYSENSYKARQVRELYENAIDDGLPRDQINDWWVILQAFERNAADAGREWHAAKAALLRYMN